EEARGPAAAARVAPRSSPSPGVAEAVSRWLDISGRPSAVRAVIVAMAKKANLPHWGSKSAINRAGDAIRADALNEGHVVALDAWRLAHRHVIHAFEGTLRARAKGKPIEVGQRLKRKHTIVDKLDRFPNMSLARM